jgi:hypothetical protein
MAKTWCGKSRIDPLFLLKGFDSIVLRRKARAG